MGRCGGGLVGPSKNCPGADKHQQPAGQDEHPARSINAGWILVGIRPRVIPRMTAPISIAMTPAQ
jgi:hypothetical protein